MFASSSTTSTRVSATPPWCHRSLCDRCARPEGITKRFVGLPGRSQAGVRRWRPRRRSRRHRMRQSRLVTGIAVVTAVAAGGVGGALIGVPALSGAQPFSKIATSTAASDGTKPAWHIRGDSALLDAAAKALNLTTQQLSDKLSDGKTTIADVAKQQKVDINKVIDAIASADRARISDIVNKPWPKFGAGPGGERHGGFRIGLGAGLDSVAKALGISSDELKGDLAKGQTIAQIAKSKNVDVN